MSEPPRSRSDPSRSAVPRPRRSAALRPPVPNRPRVDTNSPEYKRAARNYTRTLVALPILIVTSWYLFDRLALGNQQKVLLDPSATPASSVGEKRG
ncbi:uncharacterized protein GGS25DRAFT_449445 [Hypoxylon fragiforme]|uniref:uncharacterized protein n=1 Tax=Hypoxylon fragiforme TaxID=63214 RepID=UPI0020C5D44A|nr:uncharacterized protein GGS25DRAFT_449445 [Hypoxylon fragiforme]KAI2604137.1 hypothetical protein GGS25DRAFT_449445 [Hypoxylon fragiforme]